MAVLVYLPTATTGTHFIGRPKPAKTQVQSSCTGSTPVWQLLASNVTNLWLPNLEQVSKEDLTHVPNYAMILCKTKVTCRAFDSYLVEQNLTKPPRTLYMSHSSPDVYQNVVEVLGETKTKEIKQDFNQFLHVYGGSGRKSTADVLKCWSQHPLWPKLTIVGKHSAKTWMKDLLYIPWNVDIRQSLSIQELRTLQLSHGVHLCPSSQEGYGHYINEARSLGALVLTTDHAPMNEFVDDGVSGVLVQHNEPYPEEYQAMAPYFISPVRVSAGNICDGVKRILSITMEERRQMGLKARKRYESDDALMISNFEMLKANT
ncbi:hypothetical protein BDR26DRAFT_68781 [Obelidium mucronatum]|nr:hypothetical protein BDR26DRAFT_68781 [Obelidium mucronatum]